MLNYIFRKILRLLSLLFAVSLLCFALMQAAPYDVVDALASPDKPREVYAQLREEYGLNDTPPAQYLRWMGSILKGDLGNSLLNRSSIRDDLAARLPATLMLMVPAYLIALVLSLVLGLCAAARRNGRLDRMIDGLCSVGIATPSFWLGLILIYLLGYRLKLVPLAGMHSVGAENSFPDFLKHLFTPCSVMTLGFLPDLTRYVRANAIRQLNEDYCAMQRAFGAGRGTLLFRHVLPNILVPVVTEVGMSLSSLMTGSVAVETLFGWPGIGPYFMKAVQNIDYPVVLVLLMLSSCIVILGNMLADVACCLIDRRIPAGILPKEGAS